ncbi:hypothetical protein NC652_029083 [Populus alba x Populus x berolinensis]|nr:hypothetical protein NC652_029083 [Populus alba x Populus x berolinensis]
MCETMRNKQCKLKRAKEDSAIVSDSNYTGCNCLIPRRSVPIRKEDRHIVKQIQPWFWCIIVNRDFVSEDGPCPVKGTIGLPQAIMSLSLVSGVVGAIFTGAVDEDVTAIRFRESADCASSTTGLTMYLNR